MTQQQLRDYIVSKLGGPTVCVELSQEQLDWSINDALSKFNHYLCKAQPRVAYNRAGGVQIPLLPGDRGVIDCQILFPDVTRDYAQMNIFEIMYRMVFPRMPLGDWYLLKSFYKTYQQVRGTEADWYMDQSTNTMYVDCWSGPYDIFYVVAMDLDLTTMDTLKEAYKRDFRDYAVAEAKIVLARIRGKFGGTIPAPGGMLQTDADNLRTEGETKRLEIEARLDKIARFSSSPIQWM